MGLGVSTSMYGDHRIVLRVGISHDIEVLLNGSFGIRETGPLGTYRRSKLLQGVVVIGGDRSNLGVFHSDLQINRGKVQMLLVFFRAVVSSRKPYD